MFQNRIDGRRPDSPALSAPGAHPVGVRSLTLTDPDRPDVLATIAAGRLVRGPRRLLTEFWYPAAPGTTPGCTYETILRDGVTRATLHGRAARDAAPSGAGPFPLVVISHGYPGNRHLMAHLAEHLASHGYAVIAPDHPDSTYADQAAFGSTLYNRPLDQAFAIGAARSDPLISALADTERAALIGYSMGGYGALVLAGAGVTEAMVTHEAAPPERLLAAHVAGSATHDALRHPGLRAVVTFGPWGMNAGMWDAGGLGGLSAPLLLIAGSRDDVSGYAAMRAIAEGAVNTDRHLLTFVNAGHNAGAPIPAPAESYAHSEILGWAPFEHYADAVWDSVKMNTVSQHFVLAFLDLHLRGDTARAPYLDLVEDGNAGVWAMEGGRPGAGHSYWPGFIEGAANGLRFETLRKGG